MPSKIEWTEETWNPVTGCTKISPGCAHCYAERMAKRLAGRYGYPADEPFQVTLHPDRLDQPLRWKKSRRVFVCSMSDLFHKDVPTEYIGQVFQRIAATPQHTYQILTKRPQRMSELLGFWWGPESSRLKNVWLGATIEGQKYLNRRMYYLKRCPSVVKFVSVEPMLGPLDFREWIYQSGAPDEDKESWALDWIIVGCESGPGRRPMELDWARDLMQQCKATGVPVFVKQLNLSGNVSKNPAEWPEELRVREYPTSQGDTP